MPKSARAKAKGHLHDIWQAETKAEANAAFDFFVETYGVKYEKAVAKLIKDREALLAFYDFPAEHWKHRPPIPSVTLKTRTNERIRVIEDQKHTMKLTPAVLIAFVATSVYAYEFWIETKQSDYDIGEPIVGNLYVGENANGTALAYLPRNFTAFNFVDGDRSVRAVEGRIGDRPALNIAGNIDGLSIFYYETIDFQITWRSSAQFQNFLKYDGLPHIAKQHIERGLPPSGFSELFSRHIKALVLIGDGAGEDLRIGMPIEIVALDNPFAEPATSS